MMGSGQAPVNFIPVSDGGSAITSYTVTVAPGGAGCTPTLPATSCVVLGLSNGTAYTFTVVSTNGVGASPVSLASAVVTPVATASASIPTLSAWGLVLMSGLLVLQALVVLRRKLPVVDSYV
ncbi:IPTL-CTERM sorting domain-containing protein [Candidatus Nitrotoga sp. BS]|uniref:IPTL-CTERM sorting domain-containing protein n=1 Tax=Candidatus Nitrotoga sp. BS TaxID=2890408 RepID=UPI001EF1B75A|nr:IPTL-CTERM sorting domain-containing protein [Candidatus Nitrotoga sp. BS]